MIVNQQEAPHQYRCPQGCWRAGAGVRMGIFTVDQRGLLIETAHCQECDLRFAVSECPSRQTVGVAVMVSTAAGHGD